MPLIDDTMRLSPNCNNPRKVLVTGASGFIGRYVVNELLLDGTEVYVLTRNTGSFYNKDQRVKLIIGDLTDQLKIPKNISTIFHCAGIISDNRNMRAVNVVGTSHVVDTAILNDCRLVHLSSAGVVGPSKSRIIDEFSDCKPQNLYETTKYEAEQIVLQGVKSGLKATMLRPTIVFGLGRNQENDSFLHLLRSIKSGNYRNIGNGKAIYNIVHAREVARALVTLEQIPQQSGEAFFINNPISFNKFSETVSHAINCRTPNTIPFSIAFIATVCCSLASKIANVNLPLTWSRLAALSNTTIYSQSHLLSETNYKPVAPVEKYIEEVCYKYLSQGLL